MDQLKTSRLTRYVAFVWLFIGIMLLPVGIGGLVSGDRFAVIFGLALTTSSSIFIYTAVAHWRKAATLKRENEQILKAAENKELVKTALAEWHFTADEWSAFAVWEHKERKLNTFIEAAVLTLFLTIIATISGMAAWYIAAIVSAFISVIYYTIKIRLTLSYVKKNANQPARIIIGENGIIINDSFHPLSNETFRAGKVKLINAGNFNVLEFAYHWNTRKGATHDEIRVPIPPNGAETAHNIIENWKSEII